MSQLNRPLPMLRLHLRTISLSLCFSLLISTAAWAKFSPNSPTAPRGPVPSQGIRGCSTQTMLDFTALAPVSLIADLTLEHPTIAWYVPDREVYPIAIRLYQDVSPNASNPKWELVAPPLKTMSKQGIMTYSLPPELLKEGRVYAWQAILSCVPGDASLDLVAEAQFRVVSPSADLKAQLSRTQDKKARAQLFASHNFWYSAFAESPATQMSILQELIEYEETPRSSDPDLLRHTREHREMLAKIVAALK